MKNWKRNLDCVHQTEYLLSWSWKSSWIQNTHNWNIICCCYAKLSCKKTYRTIETQTDLPMNNISKLQNSTENINKTPIKLPHTQKLSHSNFSSLPLYKRNEHNITNTPTSKQTCKFATEKSLPSIKSNNSTNLPIKTKKDLSTKEKRKKENSICEQFFSPESSSNRFLREWRWHVNKFWRRQPWYLYLIKKKKVLMSNFIS